MSRAVQLPPGPRMPAIMQSVGWWSRPTAFVERCRDRYGSRFTIRLTAQEPFVIISDPDQLKQLFGAPAEVLHPGEGAWILEPIVGPNSILLLDEGEHLEARRLLLPAFHGERMAGLEEVITDVARHEIESWPRGERAAPAHPLLQKLTMEVILRAVFGLDTGSRLEQLRDALTAMLDFGLSPLSLIPQAQHAPFGRGPWGAFVRVRARADELIYAEIRARREAPEQGEGNDILSALLGASHEDGSPMSEVEIHDELLTLLVAGHETTATSLSWALERLARHPDVLARLVEEIDAGEEEAPYLLATIRETLRRRPVLTNAAPRAVKQPVTIGGFTYPVGVHLIASAWLVHHDPAIYPDPYAFRPERFLDSEPGTFTWIPFGGGRRRCVGASFAILEMQIVLRELLRVNTLEAAGPRPERTRRRAITVSPGGGAEVMLRPRVSEGAVV